MTLFQIFELVNFISGKYPSGNTLTPDRLNLLFPDCQDEVYNTEMNTILQASLGSMELLNRLLSTSILKPFKKQDSVVIGSDGSGSLPSDYVRYLSGMALYGSGGSSGVISTPNPSYREVDFVSEQEFRGRQKSVFARPELNPFVKIQGNLMFAVPFDIKSIELDYLRKPLIPVFDWVQPVSNPNRIIYLNPGNSVECSNATLKYFDVYEDEYANSLGKDPLYSQVYYSQPAGVGLNYRSRTVELEWESYMHHKFVSRLLKFVGVNLGEAEVEKFAIMQQQNT